MALAVLFILTLIAGAGVIAYVGDVIGRRMGKSRLSLFGLRPRHTAVLMTVLTGIVIAVFSLTVVLSTNKPLRKVIFRGVETLQERDRLKSETERLQNEKSALEGQIEPLRKQAEEARAKLVQAQKQLAAAGSALKKAQTAQNQLRSRVSALQRQAQEAASALAAAKSGLRQAEQSLASARTNLEQARARQSELQEQTDTLSSRLASLEKTLRDEQEKLTSAEEATKKAIAARNDAQEMVVKLRADITELDRQRESLFDKLQRDPITFAARQEIYRGVIEPGLTPMATRQRVVQVLESASDKAQATGADIGSNGRAIEVVALEDRNAQTTAAVAIDESGRINVISETINALKVPMVLQVIAQRNSVTGEQTPAVARIYINKRILPKGTVLACVTLDPAQPATEISAQIRQFMAERVRLAALDADIMPREKGRGEVSVFDLDIDRLAGLVARVKEFNGKVSLCTIVSDDVYTAGPLTLEFRVENL